MKYTVGYPKVFTSIDRARTWYAGFAHWYNTEHLHSGLGYVTPQQRRSGEANQIYATWNETIAKARERNPLRWRRNHSNLIQKKGGVIRIPTAGSGSLMPSVQILAKSMLTDFRDIGRPKSSVVDDDASLTCSLLVRE